VEAISQAQEIMGWRVYASNAPAENLSMVKAVECYRKEYRIEAKFNVLLNKGAALRPIILQKKRVSAP
jgi:transposase